MYKRELLFFIYNVEFTQGWKGNSVSPTLLLSVLSQTPVTPVISNICHSCMDGTHPRPESFRKPSSNLLIEYLKTKDLAHHLVLSGPTLNQRLSSMCQDSKSHKYVSKCLKKSNELPGGSCFFLFCFLRVPRWVISRRSMSARWCSTRHSTDPPLTRIGPVPRSPAHLGCWAARGTKTWSPNQETGRRG